MGCDKHGYTACVCPVCDEIEALREQVAAAEAEVARQYRARAYAFSRVELSNIADMLGFEGLLNVENFADILNGMDAAGDCSDLTMTEISALLELLETRRAELAKEQS